MQIPNSANVAPARSTAVLRRIADTIPTGKATTSEIVIAKNASSRLGRSRRLTFSMTGSPLRIERPRSPCSSRPIQAAYWRCRGWSSPSSRRRFSFTVASTDSAIMTSIGSPGVRWSRRNTPAVTRNRTGTVAPSRRRTRRPITRWSVVASSGQPHVLESHHPVGDRLVALHLRAEGLRLDRVHDEHHRQLVLKNLRQVAEQLLALGLARPLAAPVEQGIDLRIRDARPVERRALRGLVELVRVAVRVRAAAPLIADHLEVLVVAVRDQSGGVDQLGLHGATG